MLRQVYEKKCLFCGGEDIGQQEVEQGPQLVQVVLQGRAGQQQAVTCVQHAHSGGELRRLVLQSANNRNTSHNKTHSVEER